MNNNQVHPNDDLWYAIENNGLNDFSEADIKDIVAEVPGENDEYSWYWILKLTNKKYALLSGWCDYTGWDCQSGLKTLGVYNTALQAANAAPKEEECSKRFIRLNLVNQIKGKYPKFTYWSE